MGDKPLRKYLVVTDAGRRTWQAEDADHASEQHKDAFPEEVIRFGPSPVDDEE